MGLVNTNAIEKEFPRLYHVLYADEAQLDSLHAQVFLHLPQGESSTRTVTDTRETSAGAECVARLDHMNSSTIETGRTYQYVPHDAKHFALLDGMGINLRIPCDDVTSFCDGALHVFCGELSIFGSEAYSSIMPAMDVMIKNQEEETQRMSSKQQKTAAREELRAMKLGVSLLNTIPLSLVGVLKTKGGTLFFPLKKEYLRQNISDMTTLFGGILPFDWVVVGYVYPYEKRDALQEVAGAGVFAEGSVWNAAAQFMPIIRDVLSPGSVNGVMIPLFIAQ